MDAIARLANKAPTLSTFSGRSVRQGPEGVRETYEQHASTYVEQSQLADLRNAFIEGVVGSRTPKACLVAPYGYGKTATSIGLWRACEEAGLLALPPVSCNSFTELAEALSAWLIFMLPGRAKEIAEAHDGFLASSADALARRDEQEFGIPYQQGLASIRDKLERGYLDFEDVSVNLLAFMEYATKLALQASFRGIVVAIDEMQQLIGNANKGVLVALRQLIWGLRTRQIPLGLLLTMDPDTERTITDRAGDILHRIKDDGLYLNLKNVYDREFPARLWSQYAQAFSLNGQADRLIDRPALESLGQLCEREDLSNGPRTVVDVIQLAASRAEAGEPDPYTPLDLMNDVLEGNVRFDGDRSVIRGHLSHLLNFPYFQRSVQLANAVKLLAAFPRGCPRQVAQRYELLDGWKQLADDLRGEFVTEVEEGLALIELRHVGRPANRLNVLLRRYWMQITDEQLFAEDAPLAFSEQLIPLLFPRKVHDLQGWTGHETIALTSEGSYFGILEGTSSARFPLRRIGLHIDDGARPKLAVTDEDLDVSVCFTLAYEAGGASQLEVDLARREVRLCLSLNRPADGGLTGTLKWLEHYLSPHAITPAVALSLLRYLEHEGASESERDTRRIVDTVERLRNWLLGQLFPPELFREAGYDVVEPGRGGFNEFLLSLYQRAWPQYNPLVQHHHWQSLLDTYLAALEQLAPTARVGAAPFAGSKADIAGLFGQTRHAGFDAQARQFGPLLTLNSWGGDEGSVSFVPHPAELRLSSKLHQVRHERVQDSYRQLRNEGFASKEAWALLTLAEKRGLVGIQNEVLVAPSVPSATELSSRANGLLERAEALAVRLEPGPSQHIDVLRRFSSERAIPDDAWEAHWRLNTAEAWLEDTEVKLQAEETRERESLRLRLVDILPNLEASLPVIIPGELSNHLRAAADALDRQRQSLLRPIRKAIERPEQTALTEARRLIPEAQGWQSRWDFLHRWVTVHHRLESLRISITRLRSVGALAGVDARRRAIVKDAREALAEKGLPVLAEIGAIEARTLGLEREFNAATSDRAAAYERLAAEVTATVAGLCRLDALLQHPAYDSEDDEASIKRLFEWLSCLAARAIALFALQLSATAESKSEKLRTARLLADIQSLSRAAADPAWLFDIPAGHLHEATKSKVQRLQDRIDSVGRRQSTDDVSSSLRRLLPALAYGPIDISEIAGSTDAEGQLSATIKSLLSLATEGTIRILVDVPLHSSKGDSSARSAEVDAQ